MSCCLLSGGCLRYVFSRCSRNTIGGDEGKGKITDFLSENAEVIARYQGGNNAGHPIKFNGETYKLHLIPSGIFYNDKTCVIETVWLSIQKRLFKN